MRSAQFPSLGRVLRYRNSQVLFKTVMLMDYVYKLCSLSTNILDWYQSLDQPSLVLQHQSGACFLPSACATANNTAVSQSLSLSRSTRSFTLHKTGNKYQLKCVILHSSGVTNGGGAKYILIGKQWYQLPEFILTNSNSGHHSCISISIHTQHVAHTQNTPV